MRRPPALAAYAMATGALEPLAPALLALRAHAGKEDAARRHERLGRPILPRPPGPMVWLHGASVGESLSLLPLIDGLQAARPTLSILITSVTTTSAELLARRLPPGVTHQYAPIDTPAATAGFAAHWRPDVAVFVESELWPNLLLAAKARGAKLALISARLSERSARGWARAPRSIGALLGVFDLVLTQDEPSAQRFNALGARDDGWVNLKRVGEPLPVDAEALAQAERRAAGRPVLLAASTHAGEETFAIEAFAALADRGDALLVIVPRHPARGAEVAALVRRKGLTSSLQSAGEPFGGATVHIADALGELGLWMRLARAVFLGGGLAKGVGGHNALEPVRLRLPLASGPHVENWSEVFGQLEGRQAVAFTPDVAALSSFWRAAVAGDPALTAQAERAYEVPFLNDRALGAAVDRVLALLP